MNPETGTHPQSSERGASVVEYVLLLSLIAMMCVVALGAVGDTLTGSYDDTASVVQEA